MKIIYPEAFKINKREAAILNIETAPEPSEAIKNTETLIHVEDGRKVMIGTLKQPIGLLVENPFRSDKSKLFMPENDTSMFTAEMLRQIADAMDRLAK